MNNKHFYAAPRTEILSARFEVNILSLPESDVIDPFSSTSSSTSSSSSNKSKSSMWHWMDE